MKMNMGGMGRQRRIAGDDGVENQQMLGRRGMKPQRISPGQPTNSGQVGAYGAQGADEKGVADRDIDGIFEFIDQPVVSVHSDVALFQQLRSIDEALTEQGERGGITANRRQTNGLHLERLAQFVKFGNTVDRDVGDFKATASATDDESIGNQSGHRFPQRGARYANTLGLFDFEQGSPWCKESVEDLPAQLTVRSLTGAERHV